MATEKLDLVCTFSPLTKAEVMNKNNTGFGTPPPEPDEAARLQRIANEQKAERFRKIELLADEITRNSK